MSKFVWEQQKCRLQIASSGNIFFKRCHLTYVQRLVTEIKASVRTRPRWTLTVSFTGSPVRVSLFCHGIEHHIRVSQAFINTQRAQCNPATDLTLERGITMLNFTSSTCLAFAFFFFFFFPPSHWVNNLLVRLRQRRQQPAGVAGPDCAGWSGCSIDPGVWLGGVRELRRQIQEIK